MAAASTADTVASVLDYHGPGVVAGGLLRADQRRARQRAKDHSGDGLRDRSQLGRDAEAAGVTIIEARGVRHQIEFRVDHISNQPKIVHTTEPSPIEVGTRFTVHWPPEAKHAAADQRAHRSRRAALRAYPTPSLRFRELVASYAWFNPHLTLRGLFFGREFVNVAATRPDWDKWRPRNPTSRALV